MKKILFIYFCLQMSAPNLRGRSRATSSSRGSGVAAAHDEAALNHMMAERRRRVKQKENFATLRRLVPIISKVSEPNPPHHKNC
jgi:hypothetical protein